MQRMADLLKLVVSCRSCTPDEIAVLFNDKNLDDFSFGMEGYMIDGTNVTIIQWDVCQIKMTKLAIYAGFILLYIQRA